jgi:uncharacterized protein YndB with AHSA1/START domain
MIMTTTIITPDQDALVTEIDIAVPPERVFRALTDPAQLKLWFSDPSCPAKTWEMDARPRGKYSYATEKSATIAVNGVNEFKCHGEILEFDPPRILVYTWMANWHDDKQRKTTVRWELTPAGSGTHVRVIHSGLALEKVAREDYRGGWPGVVAHLKQFAEAGKD